MSLDLGELRIALELDSERFRAGMAAAKAEMAGLSTSAQREVVNVRHTLGDGGSAAGAEFGRGIDDGVKKSSSALEGSGRDAGGTLSRGMQQGLTRNSPLIVAGVAGALIAGAPAVIAGAGVLFGGIAAAAVHSNDQVLQSFAHMNSQLSATVAGTAQVTVPYFVKAMDRIGDAALGLRSQFSAAFAALDVPIDGLTTGLIRLTTNAMPGLVHAVQGAGPVFQGLASFLGDIGTGVGQFFDIISQHGPAAGQAFGVLGQIVGDLLPILGNLIGEGAELAADVLPPVASALGVVADVLDKIAPILPTVVIGFAAFKAVGALSGPLGILSAKLQTVAADGGKLTTTLAGTAAGGVSKLGSALPVLGVAVAAAGVIFESASQQADEWAKAMLDGGQAAATAGQEMQQAWQQITPNTGLGDTSKVRSIFEALRGAISGTGASSIIAAGEIGNASKSAKDMTDAMSPLQQANQDVTKAQNDYSYAVDEWGISSGQAVGASQTLRDAQANLVTQQAVVSGAMQGTVYSLSGVATEAGAASTQVSQLKTSLDILTGAANTTIAAEASFTQTIANAATATKDQAGALIGANGQLNTHTAAGAAAALALQQVAGSADQVIAAMISQGDTTAQVTARDAQLRDSFIQTAEKMGFTAGQANNLADQIYGIPAERQTRIDADIDQAASAIDQIRAKIAGIPNRTVYINTVTNAGPANYQVPGAGTGGYADGGYTGPGGKYDVAGPVHRDEFVFTKDEVRAAGGPGVLYGWAKALRNGGGYAGGGQTGGSAPAAAPASGPARSTQIIVQASTADEQRIAKAIADRQRDMEFLAGVA